MFTGLVGTPVFGPGESAVAAKQDIIPLFLPPIMLNVVTAGTADLLPGVHLLIFGYSITSINILLSSASKVNAIK